MATPNVANLLKSGAVIWIAPVGEARPDETSIAAGADWGGNWERFGLTSAPLTFIYEDERSDAQVEEFLGAVDRRRIGEKASAETVLAEIDATYFSYLVGGTVSVTAAGASQVGYDELDVGGAVLVDKRAVGIEGVGYDDSNNALPLRLFFNRATLSMGGEMQFSAREDSWAGMPMMVEGLIDSATGAVFTFQRVTAVATS